MGRARRLLGLLVGFSLSLASSHVWAQQMGGGGGGGFGMGGAGGGQGFGAGNTSFGQGNQTSLQGVAQSPKNLPMIMGRSVQSTFGTRQLGSGSRQRYRGFMGSSQAGSGANQYAGSGAFTQARRGTLQGSGLSTFSSFSNMGGQRGMQQGAGQMGQYQPAQSRTASRNALTRKVTVSVGFQPVTPPPTEIATTLRRSLDRARTISGSASIAGRTVVLNGVAASDHDRQLAETLALLEPGVDNVQNNLVAPSANMPDAAGVDKSTPASGNVPPRSADEVPEPPGR